MATITLPTFNPSRTQDTEARIRRIENYLTTITGTVPDSTGGGGSIGLPIAEEDVSFDPETGHNHDGDNSTLLHGVQVELDFGSIPTYTGTFTVTDSIIIAGNFIVMVQSGDAPTGRSQDVNDMDRFCCNAVAENGDFVAIITSLNGPVTGLYKFNYIITA